MPFNDRHVFGFPRKATGLGVWRKNVHPVACTAFHKGTFRLVPQQLSVKLLAQHALRALVEPLGHLSHVSFMMRLGCNTPFLIATFRGLTHTWGKFAHLEEKFELLRHQLHQEMCVEIQDSEARLMKQIDKRITRMAFGFGVPLILTNITLVASVFYR